MKTIFTMIALFFSMVLSAQPLNKIIIFGDSLSDNGNFYAENKWPLEPYYKGRFTNGPVWIEHVAKSKDAILEDYAMACAGVFTREEAEQDRQDEEEGKAPDPRYNLQKEVRDYLKINNNKADENSLYVIWIGANNYISFPENTEEALTTVLDGINTQLTALIDAGAKHFLVANMPDLGVTPTAYIFDKNVLLSTLSIEHNIRLQQDIDQFQTMYPDTQWLLLNVGQMFNDVILNPESLGFSSDKIKDFCRDLYNQPSNVSLTPFDDNADPCDSYLFFDEIHPTALAHKILGDRAIELMDKKGVTFEKKPVGVVS